MLGVMEMHPVTYLLVPDISYTLTLDADLQATRVASRGLFTKNSERSLTETARISSTPLCEDFQVYVQVNRGRASGSAQALVLYRDRREPLEK